MCERGKVYETREVLGGGGGSLQQADGDGRVWLPRMAEGPAVLRMPGNAGGGKGPWFRINAGSGEGQEIGKPINSDQRSEVAGGVTCKSEGSRTRVSLLRAVRQAVSRRCAGSCIRTVS